MFICVILTPNSYFCEPQAERAAGLLGPLDPIGDPMAGDPDDAELVTDQRRAYALVGRDVPASEEIGQRHGRASHPQRLEPIGPAPVGGHAAESEPGRSR